MMNRSVFGLLALGAALYGLQMVAGALPILSVVLPYITGIATIAALVLSFAWHKKYQSPIRNFLNNEKKNVIAYAAGLIAAGVGISTDFPVISSFISVAGAVVLGAVRLSSVEDKFYAHITKALAGSKDQSFGQEMAARVNAFFADAKDNLLRGDIKAESVKRFGGPEVAPELYIHVKEDLVNPVVTHSRLPDGALTCDLLPRRLSVSSIHTLFDEYLKLSAANIVFGFALAFMIALQAGSGVFSLGNATLSGKLGSTVQMSPESAADIVRFERDVWSKQELTEAVREQTESKKARLMYAKSLAYASLWAMSALAAIVALVCAAAAIYAFVFHRVAAPARIRGGARYVIEQDKTLALENVQSIADWKMFIDRRENALRAYRRQILNAQEDKSPIVHWGEATGTVLFRGSLHGYKPRQPVCSSFLDLQQNCLITGGTGSGKTYLLCKKVIPAAVEAVRSKTIDHDLGLLIADGKGTLWRKIKQITDSLGVPLRIIGIGDDAYGIDLLDGVTPLQAAPRFAEAMGVSGEKSKDPIWDDMAQKIFKNALKVAYVFELTPEGQALVQKTGSRIYSPANVFALISSIREVDGALFTAVAAICNAFKNHPETIANVMTPDVWDAIRFLRQRVFEYPTSMLQSFLCNVDNMLEGFADHHEIRKVFGLCQAAPDKVLEVGKFWDNGAISCIRIPSAEYGAIAGVLNRFIKINVFALAQARLSENPDIQYESKLGFIQDEAHMSLTRGTKGSGSANADENFYNISRETGVFGMLITQGFDAILAAYGETTGGSVTQNLLDQFRTMIFLSSEAKANFEHLVSLAGESTRHIMSDYHMYESFVAQRFETGNYDIDFDNIKPFDFNADELRYALKTNAAWQSIEIKQKPLVEPEYKWMDIAFSGGNDILSKLASKDSPPKVDLVQREQNIVQRAEDKRRESIMQGSTKGNILCRDDMKLGKGQAFFYTASRGNNFRMDIIDLAGL